MTDLRYAFRTLRKSPGFTAVAVLTLALGIGANTAMFSVIHAALLRPLPFADPDRIVMIYETNLHKGWNKVYPSPANFLDWRNQSQSFERIAAFRTWFYTLAGVSEPEQVWGVRVSTSFFPLLGVKAALGRTFLDEEERPGGDRVVVLSHELWQRRFGADPAILGRAIPIDGESFTVIGVLPSTFRLFNRGFDLWMPFVLDPAQQRRDDHSVIAFTRLKPDVPLDRARAEMAAIARRLEQAWPATNTGWGVSLIRLHDDMAAATRPALLVLCGAVGLVLLIACANVANLLLARTAARQREIAIREALGAGRLRLLRQFLTESVLLSILGGAAGLLLALWSRDLLVTLLPPNFPRPTLDPQVLAFSLLISLLTALFFGLAPLRPSASPRFPLSACLIVSEVALALVLLSGAGLMIRSFLRLSVVDPGFRSDHLLTLRTWLPKFRYPEERHIAAFYEEALRRIRTLPGVAAASAINFLPVSNWGDQTPFSIEGRATPEPEQKPVAHYLIVDPAYFRTMRIPLLQGRSLTDQDTPAAPPVAVISKTMARRFWPAESPIGRRIRLEFPDSATPWRPNPDSRWAEIVGVASDVRDAGLGAAPLPEVYLPYRQRPSSLMILVIRTDPEPLTLASAVRAAIREVDPDQPVSEIRTMEKVLAESFGPRRLAVILLGIFAGLALLLAAVGIYGVMAYAVTRRTHEIGVRMALGARPRDVLQMVIGQALKLVALGVAAGLAAAAAVTRFLSSLLFGVTPTDPLTFLGIAVLLTVVALAACYLPARRAAQVDPLLALRHEYGAALRS